MEKLDIRFASPGVNKYTRAELELVMGCILHKTVQESWDLGLGAHCIHHWKGLKRILGRTNFDMA
jgi:hypothetical protein